ncbi:MAG: FAD-dependent oxidoreductase [Alphaproteobacteria bacterium]|nr:FAD-dependent oxidoreductase [Alphaproteobacteria bacterium]
MRIAVIGGGISGLGAAWMLDRRHDVTVYEAADQLGGHANTVEVPSTDGEASIPVDTGFLVYNETNYPHLVALFDHLGVQTHESNMSFAVSIDGGRLEYNGNDLATLIGTPRNLVSPRHWRMIADIIRFFREAPGVLEDAESSDLTLGAFLRDGAYSSGFQQDHLLPMAAAIWSCSVEQIACFPVRSFVRFFHNHGLLKPIAGRPIWRTVTGGSRQYVRRLATPLRNRARTGAEVISVGLHQGRPHVREACGRVEAYDQVVLAVHAPDALSLLAAPTAAQRAILGAVSYQPNRAVLHADPSLMPRRKRLWASWNYLGHSAPDAQGLDARRVSATYWLNLLQGIDPTQPLFLSMNPLHEPDPALVHREFAYAHPLYNHDTVAAQARLGEIQGQDGLWFAGAWTGYGFHEDGLASAVRVATALDAAPPWMRDRSSGARLTVAPLAAAPDVSP